MWRSRVLAGLLVLGSGSSARAQEPQAIVGDWVGEWRNGLGASDAVYMTARVTEVSEAGSVPFRKVANLADRPPLLLDERGHSGGFQFLLMAGRRWLC